MSTSTHPTAAVDPTTETLPTWVSRFGFPDPWPSWMGRLFTEPMRPFLHDLRVEEFRDDGTMVVRAELPGVDPDKDLEVSVKEGVLRIHAQRTEGSTHKEDRTYRSEFRYGSFDRAVALPTGAKGEGVQASYRDGILEVRVPIDEQAEAGRKVTVAHS